MIQPRVALVASTLILVGGTAQAQDFSYPDFTSMAGLTVNANAGQAGTVLRLTPSASAQRGSCFYDLPTQVTVGFTCTFTFKMESLTGGGADGMAFVIHNAAAGLKAIGDNGSGMGYALNTSQSIDNSLVIELDTWNSGLGDPGDNHVSIHTRSTLANSYDEAYSIGNAKVPANMSDGNVHTAVIDYDKTTIEIFVDDLINPLISVPWDFATGGTYLGGSAAGGLELMTSGAAYVGFSAGTGGSTVTHDVLSWDWSGGDGPVGTNYCGPANLNSTGSSALISAWGQTAVDANSFALTSSSMPLNEMGLFICSQTKGFRPNPGASQGNLCLGGRIGRFRSQVQNTGSGGTFTIQVDLSALPVWPNQPVVPGETWNFQAWFKDGSTSNFSDGLWVLFQ